jgi:hypothetical protein
MRSELRAMKTMKHHWVAAAVHDRDTYVPVILHGLCLRRSHHLFGLIERDRGAVVTDTFVNRHRSVCGRQRREGALVAMANPGAH